MAHESDMDLNLEKLSSTELAKFIKEASGLLEKKVKSEAKQLEKVETKRVAAAPPKGVTPIQFAKNNAWVNFVWDHMRMNGWEEFTHTERFGSGVADVLYPESELVPCVDEQGQPIMDEDGDPAMVWVFKGTVSKSKPNGEQPILAHAMSLSKVYWTPPNAKRVGSGSKPELYEEFEESFVPPVQPEGAGVSAVVKKTVVRRAMTKEEKEAEKEQKRLEKEAEKEAKKAEREAERERKRQEKEAEKEQKRQEKEAEKAAKAASKAVPARAIRAMVTSKGSPIASSAVVKATAMKKAVSSSSSSSSSSTPGATIAVTPKPLTAIKKPVAPKEDWVPPAKGKSKDFTLNGVTYLRDHKDRLWTKDSDGKPDDCVGWYDVANNRIDDENVPEDD